MKFQLFALVAAVFASPVEDVKSSAAPTTSTYTSCSSTKSIFDLKNFVLTPNPIVKGKPQAVTVSGNLKTPIIAGSSATMDMKVLGKKIFGITYNLCDIAAKKGISCPIPVGAFSLTVDATIPRFVPGGKYDLHFLFSNGDQDKSEITCIDVQTSL